MIAITTRDEHLDIYNFKNTEDLIVLSDRISTNILLKNKELNKKDEVKNVIFIKELEFEKKYKLVAAIESSDKIIYLAMFTFDSSQKPNSIHDVVYLDDIKYIDGSEIKNLYDDPLLVESTAFSTCIGVKIILKDQNKETYGKIGRAHV